jgi:hypothetical protein
VLEKKMKERREFVERFGGEQRPNPEAEITYRKKVGMLEEINRVAREIDNQSRELREMRLRQEHAESGPVDLPVAPERGGGGPTPAPAPPAPTQ